MLKPEPDTNPNGKLIVDPPRIVRALISFVANRSIDPQRAAARRRRFEAERVRQGAPHRIEYFHQLDDPYSHLAAQTLERLQERYEIELVPHLVHASGGKNQPELRKLAEWARRDAALVAPHYGLTFPETAPVAPDPALVAKATRQLAGMDNAAMIASLAQVSDAIWHGKEAALPDTATDADAAATVDAGSARLAELGHYSGAMLHYGGEWFWGADRLFHLEQWLREVGACRDPSLGFICPRPAIDVSGVDASSLTLDFYPSLNSPYTSIIHDLTVAMARECNIRFNHKPVLPMIMRGVPATREKGLYIVFDTKREAWHLGVDFGPAVSPIGEPTRQIYSLLPWARSQGKAIALLSASLRLAFAEGTGLHRRSGLRKAVERAGLDWREAKEHLGSDGWKEETARNQIEMTEDMGLWGVPCYRLRGGGVEDLCVWGQDRLWLVAAEIRKRGASRA